MSDDLFTELDFLTKSPGKRNYNHLPIQLSQLDIQKYWSKIQKQEQGCWIWNGALSDKGRAHMRIGDKIYYASRIAYFLHHNVDPGSRFVLHDCDNGACVNPNHLFLGNDEDNMKDMVSKGRDRQPNNANENHGMCKYSNELVEQVRADYATGNYTQKQLASIYSMSQGNISMIINKKRRR
jgi:hypothetical protein